MALFERSIRELQNGLTGGEFRVQDLVEESLGRIGQVDGKVRAFLNVYGAEARETARVLDDELQKGGDRGLLFGLPAGLKDNMNATGTLTTCASKFLANYTSVFDATAVKKIKSAGSVIIGKLNMDEFAMGGSNENSGFHPVYNPWNTEYVPGGSSGGSAAAVAAGEVYYALGSDTGGSIRQPAAYCGVVGLKPTYGLVSRFGLVAFASSLDQIGPVTKNVEDSAYVLQAIVGNDPQDSTSLKTDVPDYISALTGDIKGLRVAVPKEYMGEGVQAEVRETVQAALKKLESLGAVIEEVSLPHTEYAVATYYLLASSEASSNLSRFDGVRYGVRSDKAENLLDVYRLSRSEGFGEEVKRRIMLGTYALSSGYYDAYYLKAQKVRTLIKNDFDKVFEKYDVIVGPTAPTPAFKIGEQVDNPLTMYLNDILTIPVNLAGIPAVSIPCGQVNGLPVGLQIIGKALDETTVLRVAHAYEQNTDHHLKRPAL
ncbi:Asp-tRNA(Asn)/Glu-tRNA(Gln) amidotransferase subunit GatA [Gorillibacterium massiliense]|uniref:Asp-tRNA(Asn)/Glu-tRNA(Gln) amidotransferase subunit GatA n=1 Tax=Gorillibacterium massiliense TaxID=1280390 RepID=UPI0004BAC723|nr:Asp-tRNA(Asn)/Glu-tRNA(Gln) amidotransferase subunit GatA [Gorillibacterium massiliense]